jgi:ATP phosphoribosyltransferase
MNNITLAVLKKWELNKETLTLLAKQNITFETSERSLIITANNKELSLCLLRNKDIPKIVEGGYCDFGIVGLDQIQEQQRNVNLISPLWLGKCRLSLALPTTTSIQSLEELQWKTLATSCPTIAKNYFQQKGIDVNLITLEGSVEIAPQLWLADGIVDIISSGKTLAENQLTEIEKICDFEAVLISNPTISRIKIETMKALLSL